MSAEQIQYLRIILLPVIVAVYIVGHVFLAKARKKIDRTQLFQPLILFELLTIREFYFFVASIIIFLCLIAITAML